MSPHRVSLVLLAVGAALWLLPESGQSQSPDSTLADTTSTPHFEPLPDRWRGVTPPPYDRNVKGGILDPYNQNVLKGDYPLFGQDTFFILTAKADTRFELGTVPTPSGISTENPQSPDFFGEQDRRFLTGFYSLDLELYKGDAAYKPRDWELRAAAVFNFNHLEFNENNSTHINPRKGPERKDNHIGVQALSFEKHLFDLNKRYDFISIRLGIQNFNSDFRNFLFRDDNLGIRLFGSAGNNRYQYNLAVFDLLEKDTNSQLNTFDRRKHKIATANIYRQDTFVKGYTAQLSILHSRDRGEAHSNQNGVPVRPSLIGAAEVRPIDVTYLGWSGDGHFGILNVTHTLYLASGTDENNSITGTPNTIGAAFAAAELSIDKDWKRFKIAGVFASGDRDPYDDKAEGFDAVLDEAFIAGGTLGWLHQNEVRLMGVNLVNPKSLLPSLKPSKTESQMNFVNPGLWLVNGGMDLELTPKLKSAVNLSYMSFVNTSAHWKYF